MHLVMIRLGGHPIPRIPGDPARELQASVAQERRRNRRLFARSSSLLGRQ